MFCFVDSDRKGSMLTAERFSFDYPRGLNEAKQPLYSGKVLITSSLGETLSVSYFGAAYNVKDQYKDMFIDNTPYIMSPSRNFPEKRKYVPSFPVANYGPLILRTVSHSTSVRANLPARIIRRSLRLSVLAVTNSVGM